MCVSPKRAEVLILLWSSQVIWTTWSSMASAPSERPSPLSRTSPPRSGRYCRDAGGAWVAVGWGLTSWLSSFQNVSIGIVGKDMEFTIYDDDDVEPFLEGLEERPQRKVGHQWMCERKHQNCEGQFKTRWVGHLPPQVAQPADEPAAGQPSDEPMEHWGSQGDLFPVAIRKGGGAEFQRGWSHQMGSSCSHVPPMKQLFQNILCKHQPDVAFVWVKFPIKQEIKTCFFEFVQPLLISVTQSNKQAKLGDPAQSFENLKGFIL